VGVLQRFEQRLDRLVNGAFARAFRAEVQPVEIAAALQRELDDKAAVLDRTRTVAPNALTVELGEGDFARLAPYAEPLRAELAAMVTEHATTQGYQLMGTAEVTFAEVDDLPTGMFRVFSEGKAGVVAQPRTPQPGPIAAPLPEPPAAAVPPVTPVAPPIPVGTPASAAAPATSGADTSHAPARLVINGTAFPLATAITTLGRGSDVDIRLDDPGVSRRHAEIRTGVTGADYSVIDLASTNGTFVGDQKVGERRLTDGDEIRIGSSVIVFRAG
jgi:hypothetical protein